MTSPFRDHSHPAPVAARYHAPAQDSCAPLRIVLPDARRSAARSLPGSGPHPIGER